MVKVKMLLCIEVVGSVEAYVMRCFGGNPTSYAQLEGSLSNASQDQIRVSYPLAALCRSASIKASNFCCSASLVSTAGSSDLLAWSLPVLSDFGRLAFCRSSSQEDRVAMLRACSARISSQRLLRWEGCAVPNTKDKCFVEMCRMDYYTGFSTHDSFVDGGFLPRPGADGTIRHFRALVIRTGICV